MHIDLDKLPIPDWGLTCPTCEYPLRGLPSHRCPECGTEFDVASILPTHARLREPRFTGRELPLPDFGLRCERCHQPLAGAHRHACAHCGEEFDPGRMRPHEDWFEAAFEPPVNARLEIIRALLDEEHVPYILRENRPAYGTAWATLGIPSEFYFEYLWLLRRAASVPILDDPVRGDATWLCPGCSEENPRRFEICWRCERPRPT